jgi:hypothetical protein
MIRKIQKRAQNMTDFGVDDFLSMLGLERRRGTLSSAVPTIGALAVGMIAGAGVALLFAPRPGKELRADIQKRLVEMRDRTLPQLVEQAVEQARSAGIDVAPKNGSVRSHNAITG